MIPARTLRSLADEDTATSCRARRLDGSPSFWEEVTGLPRSVLNAAVIGRVRADQRDSAVTLSKLPPSESESICKHARETALGMTTGGGLRDDRDVGKPGI
jgi:hypothetical protein